MASKCLIAALAYGSKEFPKGACSQIQYFRDIIMTKKPSYFSIVEIDGKLPTEKEYFARMKTDFENNYLDTVNG